MATRTFDCTRNIAVLDNSTEDTSQLFVGQNAGILARVFMKFDPDFTGMASITSATLHVHMQSTYDGPITVQVRELTGSFSESTTNWSNQPGITGAIDDFVANNPGGWETVDITDIVTAWATAT